MVIYQSLIGFAVMILLHTHLDGVNYQIKPFLQGHQQKYRIIMDNIPRY